MDEQGEIRVGVVLFGLADKLAQCFESHTTKGQETDLTRLQSCDHTQHLAAFVRAKGGAKVKSGVKFIPEVAYKGRYYPLCAKDFEDNHDGATAVCKALGLGDGWLSTVQGSYGPLYNNSGGVHAMPVGRCKPNAKLDNCTGKGNVFGDVEALKGACKAGKTTTIVEVTCGPGAGICLGGLLSVLSAYIYIYVYHVYMHTQIWQSFARTRPHAGAEYSRT